MKIQYISDLHLECSDFFVEKNGDVLVLAGDIFSGKEIALQRFGNFMERTMKLGFKAVLFVLGNHEGYDWSILEAKVLLRKMDAEYADFWFLDRSVVVIDGQRFIGASLWSLPGSQQANIHARLYINDYRVIRGWTIDEHVKEHNLDLAYLKKTVQEGDIVITHFPPTNHGVDWPRFGGDVLNSWFVNDLNYFIIDAKPALWISGHTHHCWIEDVGDTIDVGNCRGYTWIDHSSGQAKSEVKLFNPIRVINIEISDNSSDGAAS